MATKKHRHTGTIQNRRARFDYQLGDTFVVGVVLSGPETRALRLGHGQLRGAYVNVKDNELWLINATIAGSTGVPIKETDQTRTRKLLAKHREIAAIIEAKQRGSTVIPLEILTAGRYIKVRIALGKGKRQYDKRRTIQRREEERTMNRAMKSRL